MAIDDYSFRAIWEARKPGGKILCLGYPDILIRGKIHGVPEAPDSERIAGWHGWRGQVYDADAVFAAMDLRPTYIDIVRSRGKERIEDLNFPLATDLVGQFDIVLDPGTLEHCFNVGRAFQNCRAACRRGGVIIHENPLSMVNHGFWNINPGTYCDFYGEDQIAFCAQVYGNVNEKKIEPIEKPFARFRPHPDASVLVVVDKQDDLPEPFPVQKKYRSNPILKAA